jgi:hypothetical protein
MKPGGSGATPGGTTPAGTTPAGTTPQADTAAPATRFVLSGPDLTDRAAKGASIASIVLIISTLLPWVSVSFFNSSTLTGVRLAEGRITIILAFLAELVALAALVMADHRRIMLLGSAIFGGISLVATIVFAFRYRDIFDIPDSLGGKAANALARSGIGLDAGWYLAIASSLALIAFGVFGYFAGRPKAAVPNMTWVEPQA